MGSTRIELKPEDLGLSADRRQRTRMMRNIAEAVLAEWGAQARAKIKSGRLLSAYIQSLSIQEASEARAVIALPGPDAGPKSAVLARMAEFGMGPGGIGTQGPYDIRTFVLKAGTRKLHMGKNGPYVNIPFDMSPDQIKDAGGSKALKMARAMHPHTRPGPVKSGVLRRLPAGLAAVGSNKITGHSHVSDSLEGLVRRASSYSQHPDGTTVTQTSGYRKWRRMSWSGKPWMSKGVQAHHIGESVAREVPKIVKDML